MQVINARDAMGNPVFSDGLSLVFTLTITNRANGNAGLTVVQVRVPMYRDFPCISCAHDMHALL